MEEVNLKKEESTPHIVTSRNFRNGPDIENFYRFVHENELRQEARKLLDYIFSKISKPIKKKKKDAAKKKLH